MHLLNLDSPEGVHLLHFFTDSVHDPSPDFTPYNDSTTFDEDIPAEDSPTVGKRNGHKFSLR